MGASLFDQPMRLVDPEDPLAEGLAHPPPLQRRRRRGEPMTLGVVAEEVLLGREEVGPPLLGGPVEDVLADVGRGLRTGGVVGEPAEAQGEVAGPVHDPVDHVVVVLDVEPARLSEGRFELDGRRVVGVGHRYVGARRHQAKRELGEDAERAVAAVDVLEQLGRPGGGQRVHGAVAADDLVLDARVVESSVAERHGLDRTAGHGAAERDATQLGHHGRCQPEGQRGPHEGLEGHAGLGGARAGRLVDLQDVGQRRRVDRPTREEAGDRRATAPRGGCHPCRCVRDRPTPWRPGRRRRRS